MIALRRIRIFVSSPGDLDDERGQCDVRGMAAAAAPTYIFFYFCEAPIPATLAWEAADQLKAINSFRTELKHKGLVGSYEVRANFGDKVRRDLVLVLSRLLHADEPPGGSPSGPLSGRSIPISNRARARGKRRARIRGAPRRNALWTASNPPHGGHRLQPPHTRPIDVRSTAGADGKRLAR